MALCIKRVLWQTRVFNQNGCIKQILRQYSSCIKPDSQDPLQTHSPNVVDANRSTLINLPPEKDGIISWWCNYKPNSPVDVSRIKSDIIIRRRIYTITDCEYPYEIRFRYDKPSPRYSLWSPLVVGAVGIVMYIHFDIPYMILPVAYISFIGMSFVAGKKHIIIIRFSSIDRMRVYAQYIKQKMAEIGNNTKNTTYKDKLYDYIIQKLNNYLCNK